MEFSVNFHHNDFLRNLFSSTYCRRQTNHLSTNRHCWTGKILKVFVSFWVVWIQRSFYWIKGCFDDHTLNRSELRLRYYSGAIQRNTTTILSSVKYLSGVFQSNRSGQLSKRQGALDPRAKGACAQSPLSSSWPEIRRSKSFKSKVDKNWRGREFGSENWSKMLRRV